MSYIKTANREECSGCSACVNICPKSCISMKLDFEGFNYPVIDDTNCINCRLCEKVCPFSDSFNLWPDSNPDVYAAYDQVNRVGSSSGGLFYTIAKYVIEEKNGWVFGAAFNSNFQLVHIGVNDIASLQKLRGSKYVQSDLGDTYKQIKKLLLTNYVCFVGTPCQVAGLKSFLKKDYDNLILIDLVCHGVPSQQLFDEHIHFLEKKYKSKVTSYKFRSEELWGGCEIVDFANQKKVIKPTYLLSPFLYSFMYAFTYRESCYNCKFAKVPRIGDLSLADFWGVEHFFPELDTTKGCSLVLVNNAYGKLLWDSIKDKCVVRKSNVEDASKCNSNLVEKSKRPIIRDTIYDKIHKLGYARTAKCYFRPRHYWYVNIKNRLLSNPHFLVFWKRINNK